MKHLAPFLLLFAFILTASCQEQSNENNEKKEPPTETPVAEAPVAKTPRGAVETSPMVGVFYAAPSPGEAPFVKVGQTVSAGEALGIIEAMKIMNPIEATQSGVIEEILVKNGEVIQFGQPLFRYRA